MQQVSGPNYPIIAIGLVAALIPGITGAVIAERKGHNPVGFFFLGFFLGLIGLVITAVIVGIQKPEELAGGTGPALMVRYLNQETSIDRGALQFQGDRLAFIQKTGRYRFDIPYLIVKSARVLDRTNLPAGNPLLAKMMSGRKFLLEVTYDLNGYECLGLFAGNSQLSPIVNHYLMPFLGGTEDVA